MGSYLKDNLIDEIENVSTSNLVSMEDPKEFISDDEKRLVTCYMDRSTVYTPDETLSALFKVPVMNLERESAHSSQKSPVSDRSFDKEASRIIPTQEDPRDYLDTSDLISAYIREVAQIPLLTRDEELQLFLQLKRGSMAREELSKGNVTRRKRERLHRAIQDGWSAQEHLIRANTRLVISVAKKYTGRGVPFPDLIQEGNIGLMRALKKFNHHLGYKFSTYATWWIRQAVSRAVADQGRTIRVPVHMIDQISRLFRSQRQLEQKLKREPTLKELAEAMNLSLPNVKKMLQAARYPLSLEMPINADDDTMLGDFIENVDVPDPFESTTTNLLSRQVEKALEGLPPREARVLKLRYGLLDGESLTLKEVGDKMGVSRERVRQIENQALKRLRTPSIRHKLRDYIDHI